MNMVEASVGPKNVTSQTTGGFGYGLGLSIGILVIFFIGMCVSYMCTRRQGGTTVNNHQLSTHRSSTSTTMDNDLWHRRGLDETTISTYPQIVFSQLKPRKSESITSSCSICLGDYKDIDLLRLLPDCGHFFHLKCIDPWLKVNPTCPICRSSPLPTPLVEVLVISTPTQL